MLDDIREQRKSRILLVQVCDHFIPSKELQKVFDKSVWVSIQSDAGAL